MNPLPSVATLLPLLLILTPEITTQDTDRSRGPRPVSFHVIAHVTFQRNYQSVLDSVLRKAGYQFTYSQVYRYFQPKASVIRLGEEYPKHILHAFCDEIFNQTSTAILHLINPFEHLKDWKSAQFVSNLIHHVGIPVITWGPEYVTTSNKPSDEVKQLQISPTLTQQAQAMLMLLQQYKWTDYSVVYTTYAGHQDFLNAVRMLEREHNKLHDENNPATAKLRFHQLLEVKIKDTDNDTQVTKDLGAIVNSDTRIVLLFADGKDTRSILKSAARLGLITSEFAWIVAFEAIPQTHGNSAVDLPVGLLGLKYDSDEREMKQAVESAAWIWLRALAASVDGGYLPWSLPDLRCHGDQLLYWNDGHVFSEYLVNASLKEESSREDDHITEPSLTVVNVQSDDTGKENQWIEVGKWTPRGLSMQRISWLGGATGPPSGKPERYHLRVVTRPEEPYVTYRNVTGNGTCQDSTTTCTVYPRDEDGNKLSNTTITKCCTGLSIDLLQHISRALNFDVYLYEVEDFQWGNQDKHGRWDGLMRELLEGHADMAVTSLGISEERSRAVSFSEPYQETGITIIVAIREGAISATAFLEPYDYPSWCLILVFSVHTVGASIFIFEWFSPYGMDRGRVRQTEHKFSLFRTFWLMWAMLFGAAVSTDSPRGVSGKFLANIWALFAVVFLASYTANLAAFMITKEEYYDLSGIQDWRLQNPQWMKPPFKYGTIPNTSTESNIRKNNRDMYLWMEKYKQDSVKDAINNLKAQRIHAFIYDATVLEYQAGKDTECRLITVGNWYAMSGEMERLQEFWLAGACHMKQKKSSNNQGVTGGVSSHTLGILNFTSAFILLGLGTGLAALTFLLEYCFVWFGRRRLSSWDKKGCCALVSMNMGMSLTFQQSVHDALHLHRTHRCRNPVCETQLWKANHRLDMAKRQIDRLQREIAALTVEKERQEKLEVWTYDPEIVRAHNGTRPNPDVYIKDDHEDPVCPKVTLL
ncbi:hypothetical protein BaRGS_00019610 [Batillaria attramentaria]|uniref:Uncharacterized protein n=1 Tax=Batillaria attramentaria TaxID=370345 RepID=A0ABD0KQ55_9CAEN